ncbi:serine hydrolase [Streptomyces cacaoi]
MGGRGRTAARRSWRGRRPGFRFRRCRRFSTGYMLPTDADPMISPSSFGHTGRGGSLAFADPELGIAFGYAMDHIISGSDDARAASLVSALRRCLP